MARYLDVVDVLTKRGYRSKYNNHIKPLLGASQLAKLDVAVLDSFYTELRRCRHHCRRKTFVQHRTARPHQCDEHEGDRCPRNNPDGCPRRRRMCKPHVCKGLSDSTVRQIHWILSGALDRAVAWQWISVNPADHADKPGVPTPNPQPRTVDEVALLINEAYEQDEDWERFLSTKTTTGAAARCAHSGGPTESAGKARHPSSISRVRSSSTTTANSRRRTPRHISTGE
ncbi:hypothetical protein ACGFIF_01430 [Kribbella sp. NPDC049174]|uniref:hypothetical protein n=1 Tax=Kribbella sp. NPDC049174 TaxID=3364112 RepID=UPI00372471C2